MTILRIILAIFAVVVVVEATSEMYLTCHRPTSHGNSNNKPSLRSPKYLRMQEKVVRNVPCDLTSNGGYCNLPGDHYPW